MMDDAAILRAIGPDDGYYLLRIHLFGGIYPSVLTFPPKENGFVENKPSCVRGDRETVEHLRALTVMG